MEYKKVREYLLENGACDHCIGRQFREKFRGHESAEIGAAVRRAGSLEEVEGLLGKDLPVKEGCRYCDSIFSMMPGLVEKAEEKARGWEHDTFLMGCRIPEDLIILEEKMWENIGAEYCEPLKREANRLAGKTYSEHTGKKAEFVYPDISFVLDYVNNNVEMTVHSLYVYGRYQKLVRGIPQTRWPCRECGGTGKYVDAFGQEKPCPKCKGLGKMYPESVEELIGEKMKEYFQAEDAVLHGSGREDIDARMLGNGRPFVMELVKPRKRSFDPAELERLINSDKVRVTGLRKSSKQELVQLKAAEYRKKYLAVIEFSEPVFWEELHRIEKAFDGKVIKQRTPLRVAHRRPDKIRKRKVFQVRFTGLEGNTATAEILTASGTYVKELVSGDQGRTVPSFSSVIGKECRVKELDVLEVIDENA